MQNWLLYRTHQNDEKTQGRFDELSHLLRGMANVVWMCDGDSVGGCQYGGVLDKNSSSFTNTDCRIREIWPKIFETYDSCPQDTPRVFPKGGGPKRPIKWVLGHLPALQWWRENGKPEGRFMVWEHDLWWDAPFRAAQALAPAFSHHKFLAHPVKTYRPGPDAIQPQTVRPPEWLKDTTICHYTATVMSARLMASLDEISEEGCWGHCELLVPSVAHHHKNGGGAASWMAVAGHPALRPIIHRFPGQSPGKKPQRLFIR